MNPLAGLRVLLVEDEMLVGMLLEDLLQGFGCIVIGPVTSLEAANTQARDAEVDAALLDVNLAGVDAFPVAETLDRRGVPFAFVTGYRSPHTGEPFAGHPRLQKPVDKAALEQVMLSLDARRHHE